MIFRGTPFWVLHRVLHGVGLHILSSPPATVLHFWHHGLSNHKILPDLVNSSWLWGIMRVLLANQKQRNILNEYIINIFIFTVHRMLHINYYRYIAHFFVTLYMYLTILSLHSAWDSWQFKYFNDNIII